MGKYVTINTEPMNKDEFKKTVRQLISIVGSLAFVTDDKFITTFAKDVRRYVKYLHDNYDGVTDHDA